MNISHLADMIGLQGGAIISASDCTEEEVELARKVGLLAVHKGHSYIYRGKIWMANVKELLKKQDEKRELKTDYQTRDERTKESLTKSRESYGY